MKKIKKISIIEPRSPDYHVFERYRLPRLGPLIMGTVLKNEGCEVNIFVEVINNIDFETVLSSDFVAISVLTPTAPRGYEIAKLVKAEGIPVVIGGPHVTFMWEEALQYSNYVIKGEGDFALLKLIKTIEEDGDLKKVEGIAFKENERYYLHPALVQVKDLNSLPIPDFSFLGDWKKNVKLYPIMKSRGCPYDCEFCSVTPMFGRRYRFRDTELILKELEQNKPDRVFFYDDNFCANPLETKRLLKEMIRRRITPCWTAQLRVDVAKDEEMLKLMRDSNCYACYIGIESIASDTLEEYNKKLDIEMIKRGVEKFHKYGIKIHGMFVFGSDHDDVEVIRETVKFAKEYNLETVQFLILTPIPGSRLYKKLEKEKRILTKAWYLYDGHHVVFKPAKMTPLQLQLETVKAMKKFYSLGQVMKAFFRFDFYLSIIRLYARRLVRRWIKRNNWYIKVVKEFREEHWAKLEKRIKSISYDIWEKIGKAFKRKAKENV